MRPTKTQKRIDARAAFVTDEHLRILQRLVRLRAATSLQLHRLCDALADGSDRNARARLTRMEKHGLVQTSLVRPSRGAYSPVYYQVAYGGLEALGRVKETNLLKRPRQHILDFLIFRNEVYAQARAEGWRLAVRELVPDTDHARYLALYVAWAKAARHAYYEQLRARGAGHAELQVAKVDYERVEKYAPTALTFDFLLKLGADGVPSEVALLVVDDPRRSIAAQVEDLPSELHPGIRLVLRDHRTRYDLAAKTTYRVNPRLAQWRLAITRRYTTLPFTGEKLLAEADAHPLFPDLWAVRTAAPKAQ